MIKRALLFVLGGGVLVAAATAYPHGGVGVPVLQLTHPGLAEIQDAVDGRAFIQWLDADPDDDANLALLYTPNIDDPDLSQFMVQHLLEDCDPDGDGGVIFTGIIDAGFDEDGGAIDASFDVAALTREYCNQHWDAGSCNEETDCFAWGVSGVATGNYYVLGVLDDHYADGGGGSVSFSTARGLIRVTRPGDNVPPAILFTQPDGVGDQVDSCFRVRWTDSDPDDNATIRLFLKRAFSAQPAILVAEHVSEDDGENAFDMDMSGAVDLADYEVIAEIEDSHHDVWRTRSPGYITRFRARPQDGGCVGAPVEWPDGSMWPLRDGGGGFDVGDGRGDAAARPDAAGAMPDVDGGMVSGNGDAGSVTTDAGRMTDGCPGCSSSGGISSMWLAGLLLVLFRRRH